MPRRWRWSPVSRGLEILGAVWEARGVGHEVRGMRGLGHHEGGNGFSAARAQAANAQGSRRGVVVESATDNQRRPRRRAMAVCAFPEDAGPTGLKISIWLGVLQRCRAAGAGVRHHAGLEFGGVLGGERRGALSARYEV